MGTSRCRSLLLGLFIAAASGVHANAPDSSFVDSVLAVPYDDLVGELNTSYALLHRALPMARKSGERTAEGRLYGKLSTVHHLLNQLDSATYYGLRSVDIFREEGERVLLGQALCGLGHSVKRTDLQQAYLYYRQGLPLLEAEEAWTELSACYDNFGSVHELGQDRDSALYYYRKALALKEQQRDSIGIPYSLNKIAVALLPQGRFEEALVLMQRADTIRHAINDRMGLADQPVYFGDLYQAWGRYPEAIAQFNIGIERSVAVAFPYLRQYSYERIAECQEALGDHRAALAATKRATQVRDSIQSENTTRTILELKERFNAAEKDRAIALLNERAARRQLYIWISLIALVLVVVSGLLFHQVKQRRLRAERDAAIIAERDAGLKAVFDATENERRRLAAELHDGIGQQLGGLKHRLESIKSGNGMAAPLEEVIHIVDDTSREVRDLAHQMMPKALSRVGLVPALQEMLQRSFHGTGVQCAFDHFGVEAELRPELSTGLYRIAQELVGNILKHAQATQVDVQLLRNKEHLVLLVQDNGKGYASGTSSGIGLRNITDRARSLGGTFTISGTAQQGTEASVRVPIQAFVPA
jgi:signal transduction histidine kinase